MYGMTVWYCTVQYVRYSTVRYTGTYVRFYIGAGLHCEVTRELKLQLDAAVGKA